MAEKSNNVAATKSDIIHPSQEVLNNANVKEYEKLYGEAYTKQLKELKKEC